MRIFVQHCGFKQHQDYSWQTWQDAVGAEPADAEWEDVKDSFGIRHCLTTEQFSLVLA